MKKFITIVLALVLALSLCATPVFAGANSMDNFTKANTYSNQFTDINGHWATSVIQACYEYGLMNGTSATTFNPTGDLTVAQAIVMAARVHQTYAEGACTLANGPGSEWYKPYVDYALANGLVKDGEFANVNDKITRAAMAAIFSRALPSYELMAINNISVLPDVDANTQYAKEIVLLYQAGVLTGSDSFGTFKPTNYISRAEAAAIIARVAVPAERKIVYLLEAYTYGNLTFAMHQNAQLIPEMNMIANEIAEVVVVSSVNDAYKNSVVTDLSLDTWTSIFCDALTESGVTYASPDIAFAKCGNIPVVKLTTHFYNEALGETFFFGGFSYFDQPTSEMVLLVYMTMEEDGAMLNSMMKEIKINGNKIS